MLLSYSAGSYVYYNFYTKTETDTLLADKITNIGDIDLPGMLDIGTSGYTNSRTRYNATVGGYTGYAELKAATSYDMFLNLSTTRTDGGWMYFKINNDDYIQLSGSDNKVNTYKYTSISANLDVGVGAASSLVKAHVNHEGSTGHIQMEAKYRNQSFLSFGTTYVNGYIFLEVKNAYYMYCGGDLVHFYKPTSNVSYDRLKENEELIENACDTLSK